MADVQRSQLIRCVTVSGVIGCLWTIGCAAIDFTAAPIFRAPFIAAALWGLVGGALAGGGLFWVIHHAQGNKSLSFGQGGALGVVLWLLVSGITQHGYWVIAGLSLLFIYALLGQLLA